MVQGKTGQNNTGQDKNTPTPFTIGVTDKEGNKIKPVGGFSDPGAHEAFGIVFDVNLRGDSEPTAALMERYRELAKLEHAIRELYLETKPSNEAKVTKRAKVNNETKFRQYFVRLFYLAQLILEGDVYKENDDKKVGNRLSDDAAKAEVAAIANDLIDDEAPGIKNGHLRALAGLAGRLSLLFLAAYVVLMRFNYNAPNSNLLMEVLRDLKIDQLAAANFMLLWVGTFLGVCLSYAIRTHTFSLSDLTRTDSDYLTPEIRLVLAGAFATLLTLFCVAGLGDVAFGNVKLTAITTDPRMAFIVGAVFGISEQKLSGTVEKRVGKLFGSVEK